MDTSKNPQLMDARLGQPARRNYPYTFQVPIHREDLTSHADRIHFESRVEWNDQGANFDGHWSYKLLAKPDLAKVESENPFEHFT